jgi:pyrroloquinoline quinone (PQQ) biosynthesis protein C
MAASGRKKGGRGHKLYPVSKARCKVERLNAWMDNYRVLVVRYERKAAHYLAYCTLAAILFCLKRLV